MGWKRGRDERQEYPLRKFEVLRLLPGTVFGCLLGNHCWCCCGSHYHRCSYFLLLLLQEVMCWIQCGKYQLKLFDQKILKKTKYSFIIFDVKKHYTSNVIASQL